MEEEFLEEISLTLSQPLEKQIESRVQCDTSKNPKWRTVGVNCITSVNNII
jgi:hypothetical protein